MNPGPQPGDGRSQLEPLVRSVNIPAGEATLAGELVIPTSATGLVIFAHGSGSSRRSPRNQLVARTIQAAGLATLRFDLLSPTEEAVDAIAGHLRFNIELLARRLALATQWALRQPATRNLNVGYFGASTGGAAALVAAAELGPIIDAVISRGGRPDLAGDALPKVCSPTLLIIGGRDETVLNLNREAFAQLTCEKQIEIVPGATHLFEESEALEKMANLATRWFERFLNKRT